jgi:hypothetical protein
MIGILIYLLTPPVVAALVFLEHRLLWRVKRDTSLEASTSRILFFVIFLSPLVFYLVAATAISGIYLTGTYAWLGETQSIGLLEQFWFNLLIVVMVTWPFLGMYTILGGLIAFLVWREPDQYKGLRVDTGSY